MLIFVLYKKKLLILLKYSVSKGFQGCCFAEICLSGNVQQHWICSARGLPHACRNRCWPRFGYSGHYKVINFSFGMSLASYCWGRSLWTCWSEGHATTFFIDGDEKHATGLVALLERARKPMPTWLLEMAKDAAAAASRAEKKTELTEEELEEREIRKANREKQQLLQRARKAKEKGHGTSSANKPWRKKKR